MITHTIYLFLIFFLIVVLIKMNLIHNKDVKALVDEKLNLLVENADLKMRDQVQSYTALEQGLTEIQENYENEFLDFQAKIAALAVDNVRLREEMNEKDDIMVQHESVIDDLKATVRENDLQISQYGAREQNHLAMIDDLRTQIIGLRRQVGNGNLQKDDGLGYTTSWFTTNPDLNAKKNDGG